MNQDGETDMPEIRKAVQTDRTLLEKMYLKDIKNHEERETPLILPPR
jgi:predicted secreted Zn-dependent protease